jgi:hypothetical protein
MQIKRGNPRQGGNNNEYRTLIRKIQNAVLLLEVEREYGTNSLSC